MNKRKIFGLTIITWLIFSALAQAFMLVMQQRYPEYSLNESQPVIWSWMSLIMGFVMAFRLRKWLEILWGVLFFILCIIPLPFIWFFMGIGYFTWCYTKLEKQKLLIRLNASEEP